MKATLQEILKKHITQDEPFGPSDAALINANDFETIKTHDYEVLTMMFDPNNKIAKSLKSKPSIVFGRRGSGKTSCLNSAITRKEYKIIDIARSSRVFGAVIEMMKLLGDGMYFTDTVSDLWEEMLISISLFPRIIETYTSPEKDIDVIRHYLINFSGVTDTKEVKSFMWSLINSLKRKSVSTTDINTAIHVLANFNSISFEKAATSANNILLYHKNKAIMLADSFDDYPMKLDKFEHAISGLLRCVGAFNKRHENVHLQLCLPTELYHVLKRMSVAPSKDFNYTLILQWHAQELLSIAAHRLNLYLALYYSAQYTKRKLENKEVVRQLLDEYLPKRITNGLGMEEDTIAYILRHTQLLPRNLVMYFNAIYKISRDIDPNHPYISERAVIEGIMSIEHTLTEEVCFAYSQVYLNIEKICQQCIPELPSVFSDSYLHKIFNQRGKKASGLEDFNKFKDLLTETGIIGVVIGETERYIIGRFEYTTPNRLARSVSDNLCLHPVFAKVYKYKKNESGTKAIYPYGSDPDGDDYRDICTEVVFT